MHYSYYLFNNAIEKQMSHILKLAIPEVWRLGVAGNMKRFYRSAALTPVRLGNLGLPNRQFLKKALTQKRNNTNNDTISNNNNNNNNNDTPIASTTSTKVVSVVPISNF